jgi:hypothetical protein
MVDCDGLFWSKASECGLLVVFLKRLFGALFARLGGPAWPLFPFTGASKQF